MAGCDVTLCGSKWLCGELEDDLAIRTTKYHSVLHSTTKYYSVLQSTTPYYKVLIRAKKLNAQYNARSNRSHPGTSPNMASATQNDSDDGSLSHMKRP